MARLWHVIAIALQIVGATLLVYVTYTWGRGLIFQAYQDRRFDQLRSDTPSLVSHDAAQPGEPLGRIEIPRIGLSVIIVEGVEESELLLGVGHVPGTSRSPQRGNIVLAGHRDTFFRPLKAIAENDRIELETVEGKYSYIVQSVSVTDPADTDSLRPTVQPQLTLITCYPFSFVGSAPERLIVRAVRVP